MRLEHAPIDGFSLRGVRDQYDDPRRGHVHRGIDLRAARGTPVRSTVAGRVLDTPSLRAETGLSGWGVSVRDADGNVHHFAHLDGPPVVAAGDRVTPGQRLGSVGSSGNADERYPHLHYQITAPNGERLNPYPLLVDLHGRSTMPGAENQSLWVTMTGQDRYPSGEIVRLPENATREQVNGAARLLRQIVDAYRVPSRLTDDDDDRERMRAVAQAYRDAIQNWTQAAMQIETSRGALVINAVSANLEHWLELNRQIVATGPAPSFSTAFTASVRETGETISHIVEGAGRAASGIGFGAGAAVIVILYFYLRKKA